MRLCLIASSRLAGGSERCVSLLAKGFAREGDQVDVITLSRGPVFDWLRKSGQEPRVIPVLELSPRRFANRLCTLRRGLKNQNIEVAHVHFPACFFDPSILLGIRLAGIKNLAATFHHPTPNLPRHAKIFRTALKMCRHVIFDTQENLEFSERDGFVAPGQGKVCRLGVDDPLKIDKRHARIKLGLPQDTLIIGCLARQSPDKRVQVLISSVQMASKLLPNLCLAVAGSGELEDQNRGFGIEILGDRFTHFGALDDIQAFMAAIDIFALPSELEGFGLVYVEAGAQGVPSIGCRGGGIANAIVDGQTGYLIDPTEPASELAEKIVLLAQDADLRQQMGTNAERHYLENYSLAATVAAHRELYMS